MRTSQLSRACAVLLVFCAGLAPVRAQWNQNSDPGPYEYTDPANWVGGTINNLFSTAPANGLTLTFNKDFILTNGLVLGFLGSSNITLRSDSATPRLLSISLGSLLRTNQNGGTITVGTNGYPLVLDLYGHTRNLGGATPLAGQTDAAHAGTMNIYAQIVDTSPPASHTNGVILGMANMYTYLLNDSNSFTGPVTFGGYRGGGFSSITNIGAGPSALGAPTDTTNGAITIVDNTSYGELNYLGAGNTSDRPFIWNLTGNLYNFQNKGTGKLTLTGPWTLPYATGRTIGLTINALSAPIEFAGCLDETRAYNNGSAPTLTNLVFKAGWNTNRVILTCPTNNFAALELTNVVLAFNSIADAGLPCALGTNAVIVHRGNTTSSGSANPSGQGATLQYFGPSATNNRTVQFTGSGYDWGIDNAGTNTTLTFTADFTTAFTGSGVTPRYYFLNPNAAGGGSSVIELDGALPDIGPGATLVIGSPVGYTVNNGGVVRVLNPNNSFTAGVQVKYARTLQAMSLADNGTPCSIGAGGGYPPNGMTMINLGSTDSQRGGTLAYIGTSDASCNRQISVLGLGSLSSGTLLNNSPNNSSLHFSDTGLMNFNSGELNCTVNLGGSAVATNILDESIPNTANASSGVVGLAVVGSIWQLTGYHSYTGTTLVTNGTMLVEGNIGPAADVTVQMGGVLGGTGTIYANVNVFAGGTVAPGDGIGTLTVNGNLTNNGTLAMQLDKDANSSDQVLGLNTLVYGGTLALTNVAGTLAPGDSFKLFTATTYVGNFASVSPATPGNGLAWDLSGLTNGIVGVVAGASTPPGISGVRLSGANLIISGSNGTPNGTVYLVAATNVSEPLNWWVPVQTNAFDGNGTLTLTNAVRPGIPQQFFRLKVP